MLVGVYHIKSQTFRSNFFCKNTLYLELQQIQQTSKDQF